MERDVDDRHPDERSDLVPQPDQTPTGGGRTGLTVAAVIAAVAGLLLILGVDHLLDMGRSATNVVGNSVAAAVVAVERRARTARAVVRSRDV